MKQLKEYRNMLGLSQSQIGVVMGYADSSAASKISQMENGHKKVSWAAIHNYYIALVKFASYQRTSSSIIHTAIKEYGKEILDMYMVPEDITSPKTKK